MWKGLPKFKRWLNKGTCFGFSRHHSKPNVIYTDAGEGTVGVLLSQKTDKGEKPIAYQSINHAIKLL